MAVGINKITCKANDAYKKRAIEIKCTNTKQCV